MYRYLRILAVYAMVGVLMVFATWRLGMRHRLVAMVFTTVMGLGLLHCLAVLYSPGNHGSRSSENGDETGNSR